MVVTCPHGIDVRVRAPFDETAPDPCPRAEAIRLASGHYGVGSWRAWRERRKFRKQLARIEEHVNETT